MCERVSHARNDRIAQLPFQVSHAIDFARTADLLVKDLRIGDLVGVDPITAHADRTEFLVANRDRRRSAPALVRFHACGEEINIRLEWRLEGLVPIHDVGQNRQSLGAERVKARPKDIGDLAFIYEDSHLRFTNGELAAVLNLHIFHGVSVSQYAVFRLGPLDYIYKLL